MRLAGATELLRRLYVLCKARFPNAHVVVRGDSAFATPRLMAMLDELNARLGDVDSVFGKARNKRLEATLEPEMEAAQAEHLATSDHVRRFSEFRYAADSWPYDRRVVAKAEYGGKGRNPRFVVTTLRQETPEEVDDWYC